MADSSTINDARARGFLNVIERVGNAMPDPSMLFVVGTLIVMVVSALAVRLDWSVEQQRPFPVTQFVTLDDGTTEKRPVLDASGEPIIEWRATGEPLRAQSLLTSDGLFWAIKNMVANFIAFPPLGIVLVGMLGVGVAERTGLIAALLKAFMLVVPAGWLTPAIVFIGVNSSLATDAGYIVLPPLAAALYKAVGRSPVVGIAAAFAGIAGGFNANLLITSLDPLLAGLTTTGAQVIEADYVVNPTCNWWFMIASTFLITLLGWWVTTWLVEPRFATKSPEDGGPTAPTEDDLAAQQLSDLEFRGLVWAGACALAATFIFIGLSVFEGAPLHGQGDRLARWAESIVPMIFFGFLVPGVIYGIVTRTIRNDKDVAKMFIESMAAMAPIIVLAFFAGQFLKHFEYSGLDDMLAMWGGAMLGRADLPPSLLIIAFILVTIFFDLIMASMSAKWTVFSPVFIPMFMMVGISPELTQCSYRIGDSVANIITPLNAYLLIILVFMQKFAPRAGMGTLIATMLPYSIIFGIAWMLFLLLWMALGIPLGPDGPLTYTPTS